MYSKNFQFIFTLDYELFGDGSGDVFEDVVEPTEELLKKFQQADIKITIFFEIVEYCRLKEQWDSGNTMGYERDPIAAMENQLQNAVREGHDVQLHVHPQWVDAKFEDKHWSIDDEQWRLSDFRSKRELSLEDLLRGGKETLEEMIRPVKPDYECLVLRAGWYNVDPSDKIIEAMKNVGLEADSSVVPGAFSTGNITDYDFRKAPQDMPYWYCQKDDIRQPGAKDEGVLELPVFGVPLKRYRKINVERILSLFGKKRKTTDDRMGDINKLSFFEKLKYLFQSETFTWDYCLFSKSKNKKAFRKVNELSEKAGEEVCPIVLIGHSKIPVNESGLSYLFKSMESRNIDTCTLWEAVESLTDDGRTAGIARSSRSTRRTAGNGVNGSDA